MTGRMIHWRRINANAEDGRKNGTPTGEENRTEGVSPRDWLDDNNNNNNNNNNNSNSNNNNNGNNNIDNNNDNNENRNSYNVDGDGENGWEKLDYAIWILSAWNDLGKWLFVLTNCLCCHV